MPPSNHPSDQEKRKPDRPEKNDKQPPSPMKGLGSSRMLIIALILVGGFVLVSMFSRFGPSGASISLNEVAEAARQNLIERVIERGGTELVIVYKDDRTATSYKSFETNLIEVLGLRQRAGSAVCLRTGGR